MGGSTVSRDRAMDKMIKTLERFDRKGSKSEEAQSLLDQIKERNPDNWQDVIKEMQLEASSPAYVTDKRVAEETFKADYYREIPQYQRNGRDGISEKMYVTRKMTAWKRGYGK